MNITNPSKALIVLVALIGLFVLIGVKSISSEAGLPIVCAIVGYGIGNGIGKGQAPPIWMPKSKTSGD